MQEALQEKISVRLLRGGEGSGPQDRNDHGTVFVPVRQPSATGFQPSLAALGYNPHPISVDNYFRNQEGIRLMRTGSRILRR